MCLPLYKTTLLMFKYVVTHPQTSWNSDIPHEFRKNIPLLYVYDRKHW
jgi:hypothetical protein